PPAAVAAENWHFAPLTLRHRQFPATSAFRRALFGTPRRQIIRLARHPFRPRGGLRSLISALPGRENRTTPSRRRESTPPPGFFHRGESRWAAPAGPVARCCRP